MSTLTVERHPVCEVMDAHVAADLTIDIVNVTRSLFALAQPTTLSALGPAGVNVPAGQGRPAPPPPALSIPAPPIPKVAHVRAAIPVAMPVPALSAIPLPAPSAIAMPSAIPMPAQNLPAPQPVHLTEPEAVAVPSRSAAPRTMAMLSEIEFLDD